MRWAAIVWFRAFAIVSAFAVSLGVRDAVVAQYECQDDPLNLKSSSLVLSIIDAIGVPKSRIGFAACPNSSFKTSTMSSSAEGLTYRIVYPTGLSAQEVLGPVVHELGHVAQFAHGRKLLDPQSAPSVHRRELEADFLAGIFLRRYAEDRGRLWIQHSSYLRGSYEKVLDWPGDPVQRQNAFRFGFFHKNIWRSIPQLMSYFDDDGYGEIKAIL